MRRLSLKVIIKISDAKIGGFMIDRSTLKEISKNQLNGQWTKLVFISLLITVIEFLFVRLTYSIKSLFLIQLCMFLPITLISIGTTNLYLKLSRGNKVKFRDMFVTFKTCIKAIALIFLQTLILLPTTLISYLIQIFILNNFSFDIFSLKYLIISLSLILITSLPTMILTYYLYPSLILICEDNSRSIGSCISNSFKLMHGHICEFFILQLSFLGLTLLSSLTLFIGLLWVIPYMNTVNMNFFNKITETK